MNKSTFHLDDEQLQRFVDRVVEGDELKTFEDHVAECAQCRSLFDLMTRVDRALRQQPLERVRTDFSDRIMERLGYSRTPFLFRLFGGFAYLFAFLVIATVMITIFAIAGVIDSTTASNSVIAYRQGFQAFSSWVTLFSRSIQESVGPSLSGGTLRTLIWVMVGGTIVVLGDRLYLWRAGR